MRPVRLTIGGLNSFESTQTIDFESLSSKGLFGIFGPTGSGKSTIIDGIVMSLYGPGSMPRGTKDFINTECDQAELEFVFRTALEGIVREIEIRRVFRRSGEGYRSHQSRLVVRTLEGEILQIEDKQNEVNHRIQDILGLSDSEFLKMVVLPQGKFSEFIQLDPKDRRNMLQNLFGLEIYGDKLLERLKKVLGKLQSQRDQLEGQLAAYADVDQSKLMLLKDKAAHWDRQTLQLEGEVQRLKAVYDALSQQYDRQKRLQALKEAALRHEEARSDYLNKKGRLELYGKAAAATEAERHFRQSEKLFEESHRVEMSAAADYAAAKDAFESHGMAFKNLEQAFLNLPLMKHEAALAKNKWIQGQAVAQLKLEREKLITLVEAQRVDLVGERHKLEALDQTLTECSRKLEDLTELQEKEGMSSKSTEAFLAVQSKWEKLAEEMKSLKAVEGSLEESQKVLAQFEQTLGESQGKVKDSEAKLQAVIDEFETLSVQRDQSRDQQEKMQRQSLALASDLETLKGHLRDQMDEEKALEALRSDLSERAKRLEESRDQYNASLAARLRTTLNEGDPCPVCGHLYSAHETDFHDEADYAWLRRFEEEDQAIAVLRHQELRLVESLTKRQVLMAVEGDRGQGRLAALEAEVKALALSQELQQKERAVCESRLEALKKDQAAHQSQVKAHRDQADRDLAQLSAQKQVKAVLESKRDMTLESLVQLEKAIQTYLETWHSRIESASLVDAELEQFFDTLAEKKLHSELRLTEIQRIQAERERENEKKMIQLQNVNASTLEKERLDSALKQIEAELDRLTSEVGAATDAEELEKTYKRLCRQIEVTESEYPLEKSKQSVLQTESERLKNVWISAEAALKAGGNQLEDSRQSFEEKWKGAGFLDVLEWRAALLNSDEAESLNKWIQDYEVQGRTLKEKMEEYQDLSGASVITEDAIASAATASIEVQEAWTRALEARSTAVESLKVMTLSLEQKRGVEKQLADLNQEAGYFEVLQKLLRGNRFVEFLAMNQLDYILKEASRRLMIMTANRYRLEVDSRGNFRISDHHQGGVSRDLRSLSGGETFMASLALALAMSSRLQLRGKIRLETFLLDEGFGSLDAALLDVVMHSLETLIGDQLSVGLISHVEALKARVPVRLDVTPAEPCVSGTRVQVVVN